MPAQPKTILIGVPFTMLNGITYALPVRQCDFAIGTTNGNVQVNALNNTTTWQSLTLTTGQFRTSQPFIKTTETTLTIIAKSS